MTEKGRFRRAVLSLWGTLNPVGSKSVAVIRIIISTAIYKLDLFLQFFAEIAEVIKCDRTLMKQIEDIVYDLRTLIGHDHARISLIVPDTLFKLPKSFRGQLVGA